VGYDDGGYKWKAHNDETQAPGPGVGLSNWLAGPTVSRGHQVFTPQYHEEQTLAEGLPGSDSPVSEIENQSSRLSPSCSQ
jgi:hypothetical protein